MERTESIPPLAVVDPKEKGSRDSLQQALQEEIEDQGLYWGRAEEGKLLASAISVARMAKVHFELLLKYILRLEVIIIFYIDLAFCIHLLKGRCEGEGRLSTMDLKALDSPEYVNEEEAFTKRVEEQESPPVIVEEAQLGLHQT